MASESAQVGVDVSSQGGASFPQGPERVNEQVEAVVEDRLETLAPSLDTLPSPERTTRQKAQLLPPKVPT